MRRTVQDVMTREVVAVRGPTPFKELVRLLNAHRVTAMPVLDDAGRTVVGVVSETDLALKEVAPLREAHTSAFETPQHRDERAKAASLTAARLMTAPAVTIGPEELVEAAARRMYEVNDGIVRLVGRVRRRSQALTLEKVTGAVDGVVAVESQLTWRVDDIDVQPVPPEPAPLG